MQKKLLSDNYIVLAISNLVPVMRFAEDHMKQCGGVCRRAIQQTDTRLRTCHDSSYLSS